MNSVRADRFLAHCLAQLAATLVAGGTLLALTPRVRADGAAAPAEVASAADASPLQLKEVVVTAEKHVATEQNTPISMAVEAGDDLTSRGIIDVTVLAAATPGVSLKSNGPGQTEFEMRGMTSSGGNSPTVGFYLDDVALTAPAGAQNGKVVLTPPLYDLARTEILRGPQGTLYGSGSMGGTFKLITNQPDLTGYQASAQSAPRGVASITTTGSCSISLWCATNSRCASSPRNHSRAAGSTGSWRIRSRS
jgi:outer membrane receptor protein involved in Fe transport